MWKNWEPRLLACSKHAQTETEEMCERQQSCISSGTWAGGVNGAFPSPARSTAAIHHFYGAIN